MRGPFKYGFPPRQSVHCVLLKKKGSYVSKLRIVQLFLIAFNSALKYILGRRLLYHWEEQGINSNQTHGSRPGRSTYDALIVGNISHDIARLENISIVTVLNDVAECYNRTRHNLITISTRKMGCPKKVAICHSKVLNQMQHFFKTKFGISEGFIHDS